MEKKMEHLLKEFECPLCLCKFKDPVYLPCLHSFCKVCCQQLCEKLQPQQPVTCPLCRATTPLPAEGFPLNFWINNCLEVLKTNSRQVQLCQHEECEGDEIEADVQCVDCKKMLCKGHSTVHSKAKKYEGHVLKLLKG